MAATSIRKKQSGKNRSMAPLMVHGKSKKSRQPQARYIQITHCGGGLG